MVSVWLSQGEAVQIGAVGPMMLGSGSVAVYAIGAMYMFPFFVDKMHWCGSVFIIDYALCHPYPLPNPNTLTS